MYEQLRILLAYAQEIILTIENHTIFLQVFHPITASFVLAFIFSAIYPVTSSFLVMDDNKQIFIYLVFIA